MDTHAWSSIQNISVMTLSQWHQRTGSVYCQECFETWVYKTEMSNFKHIQPYSASSLNWSTFA